MDKIGPQTTFSDEMHGVKYRAPKETFSEAMNRISGAVKDDEDHFRAIQDALLHQRFLFGGRVQASMGATKLVSPINCFMSGNVEDSFVDGEGHIMQRATEAAATMRLGGGIGTNFSTLRPSGALISKLGSTSSGSVSFMEIFNSVGGAVASSGHRRGAQMGVLRIDHPDIEAFIHAKNDNFSLTAFNISVLATDDFMKAVEADGLFDLVFNGTVYQTIRASALWDMIMRSTYDYAEPGILFIDQIQRENNLWYCEEITGTNPCGEIPLPPFGACLLGSFNLAKYVREDRKGLDYDLMKKDIPHCVRALDNVIDRASIWPMEEQRIEMESKRRVGIGYTALANALEAIGHPYASKGFLKEAKKVSKFLRDECYRASIELAKEKGPFPLFDADKHAQGPFIQRLPEGIQEGIQKFGIRNSHLLALAPTGTISLTADNVSSSLEPVFAYEFDRIIGSSDGPRTETVLDFGVREFGVKGVRAGDLLPLEHLDVLSTVTPFFDQSISKTINVPSDISWDDFKNVYMEAWKRGCKGCTTFRVGGKRQALLTEKEESSCTIDPDSGRRECS